MVMIGDKSRFSLKNRKVDWGQPTRNFSPILPADRVKILQELKNNLSQRLVRYSKSPKHLGAKEHDRLVLQALQEDLDRAWDEASDANDTDVILSRVQLPFRSGSSGETQFKEGFAWSNQSVARFMMKRMDHVQSRPASRSR